MEGGGDFERFTSQKIAIESDVSKIKDLRHLEFYEIEQDRRLQKYSGNRYGFQYLRDQWSFHFRRG